eukprot:SAG11_NODE_25779_length_354_cov_0.772549_1_plen_56_part_00
MVEATHATPYEHLIFAAHSARVAVAAAAAMISFVENHIAYYANELSLGTRCHSLT